MPDRASASPDPREAYLREAVQIISQLLRVSGWRNCRSGSEKSQAYYAAARRASEFVQLMGGPRV